MHMAKQRLLPALWRHSEFPGVPAAPAPPAFDKEYRVPMRSFRPTLAALALLTLASATKAAPGMLDPAFGTGGVVVSTNPPASVFGSTTAVRKDGALFQGTVRFQ